MSHDLDTILGWRGRSVLDRDGERIGDLTDLYLDERTERPAYAGVSTGLFGLRQSIVPLADITEREDDLVVPFTAEQVRDAPSIDPDESLDPADEERLATHYSRATGEPVARDVGDEGEESDEAAAETPADRDAGRTKGTTGDDMIRSEEEVLTGTTEMRPKERVRIRKVLVTDHVKRTVPVQREEVRLETDPPPGDVADDELDRDAER
jgi:stress response protein YsnF